MNRHGSFGKKRYQTLAVLSEAIRVAILLVPRFLPARPSCSRGEAEALYVPQTSGSGNRVVDSGEGRAGETSWRWRSQASQFCVSFPLATPEKAAKDVGYPEKRLRWAG